MPPPGPVHRPPVGLPAWSQPAATRHDGAVLPIRPTRPARTALVALLALLGCAALGPALTAAPASATATAAPPGVLAAQTTVPPTTTTAGDDGPSPVPRIIPLPNSGEAPRDAGDRGGWLQVSLFWFLLGALALIALLIWRDGYRKKRKAAAARAARAAAPAAARTPAGAGGSGTDGPGASQHG